MNANLEGAIAIYVALAVTLAVWATIAIYLWQISGQARSLRRRLERLARESQQRDKNGPA